MNVKAVTTRTRFRLTESGDCFLRVAYHPHPIL